MRILNAISSILALILFTNAFFLHKIELPDISQCDASPSPSLPPPAHAHGCWLNATLPSRPVVLLLVDALRFDFVLSDLPSDVPRDELPFYLGNLPVVAETLLSSRSSFLFHFRADPPTTTMQRLTALLTGGLPTFFEMRLNYDSPELLQDNLLRQLRERRSLFFAGDDTWLQLFPSSFHAAFPFPSMNVKDLHTVDAGVEAHLLPALRAASADFYVGHMLGVDHVGHRHGPDHPEMRLKLAQVNRFLAELIGALPPGALLLVMGDHGMTSDGNHGGATDPETDAVLFAHFAPEKENASSPPSLLRDASLPLSHVRTVDQIDLLPTLSLLLGAPIPYGNLGQLIPELFLGFPLDPSESQLSESPLSARLLPSRRCRLVQPLQAFVHAAHLNAWQVHRYLRRYSLAAGDFSPLQDRQIAASFARANLLHAQPSDAAAPCGEEIDRLHLVYAAYADFLTQVAALCRAEWTAFDLPTMSLAIAILAASAVLEMLHLVCPSEHPTTPLSLALLLLLLDYFVDAPPLLEQLLQFGAFASLLCALGMHLLHFISRWRSIQLGSPSFFLGAVVPLVFYCAGLFANSFIEATETVVYYLLVSTVLFLTAFSASFPRAPLRPLPLFSALAFFICASRGALAWSRWMAAQLNTTTLLLASILTPLSLLCIFLTVAFVDWQLHRRLHNPPVSAPHRALYHLFFFFALLLIYLFWTHCPDSVLLPRLVYGWTLLSGLLSLIGWKPSPHVVHRLFYVGVAILTSVILLQGSRYVLAVLLSLLQLVSFVALVDCIAPVLARSPLSKRSLEVLLTSCWIWMTFLSFFSWGNQFSFSVLSASVAFIGFEEFHYYAGAVLLGLRTFAAPLLYTLFLPCFAFFIHRPLFQPHTVVDSFLSIYSYSFSVFSTLTTIFVTIARRHLMIWRVFAPKFIFDALFSIIISSIYMFFVFYFFFHRRSNFFFSILK